MTRNRYILPGFLLLAVIILLSCGQSMAVVPYSVSMEEKPEVRIKKESLLEIIEKIKTHEKESIKFYHDMENELKQILKKEGTGNEG